MILGIYVQHINNFNKLIFIENKVVVLLPKKNNQPGIIKNYSKKSMLHTFSNNFIIQTIMGKV